MFFKVTTSGPAEAIQVWVLEDITVIESGNEPTPEVLDTWHCEVLGFDYILNILYYDLRNCASLNLSN